MMRNKRHSPLAAFAVVGLFLLISFENCTQISSTTGPAASSAPQAATNLTGGNSQPGTSSGSTTVPGGGTGNGDGYEGKTVFIDPTSLGDQCSDGSLVNAMIVIDNKTNVATLERESCQAITPLVLAPSSYTRLSYAPSVLIYQNRMFEMTANPNTPPNGDTLAVEYVCRDLMNLQVIIYKRGSVRTASGASGSPNWNSGGEFSVTQSGTVPTHSIGGTDAAGDIVTVNFFGLNADGTYAVNIDVRFLGGSAGIRQISGTCWPQ